MPERFELAPIGRVESPLTDPASAPKQGTEGAPDAWLFFESAVLEGLGDIEPGDEVIVLTWHDRGSRDVLRVHPRDDVTNPMRGVFSTARPTGRTRSGCTPSRSCRLTASGSGCET